MATLNKSRAAKFYLRLLENPLHLRKKNLWLCLPIFATGLGDAAMTLVGTKLLGWETNPIWRWYLHHGMLAFTFGFLGYLILIGLIVAYSPARLAKVLCLTMVVAHAHGFISWFPFLGVNDLVQPLACVIIAFITVTALKEMDAAKPALEPPSPIPNQSK